MYIYIYIYIFGSSGVKFQGTLLFVAAFGSVLGRGTYIPQSRRRIALCRFWCLLGFWGRKTVSGDGFSTHLVVSVCITEHFADTFVDSSSGSEQDPFTADCFGIPFRERIDLDLDILDNIEEIQLSRARTGLWDLCEHRIQEFSEGIALVELLQSRQSQSSCSATIPMAGLDLGVGHGALHIGVHGVHPPSVRSNLDGSMVLAAGSDQVMSSVAGDGGLVVPVPSSDDDVNLSPSKKSRVEHSLALPRVPGLDPHADPILLALDRTSKQNELMV